MTCIECDKSSQRLKRLIEAATVIAENHVYEPKSTTCPECALIRILRELRYDYEGNIR